MAEPPTFNDPDLAEVAKTLRAIRGYLGFMVLSFLIVAVLILAGAVKLQIEVAP